MRFFRIMFNLIISEHEKFPLDKPPVRCLVVPAESYAEAKMQAEKMLQDELGHMHGYSLTRNEELKIFEIALQRCRGARDTTEYPEDWVFRPEIERFFAATPSEAEEISKTQEAKNSPEFGGRLLARGPVEIKMEN